MTKANISPFALHIGRWPRLGIRTSLQFPSPCLLRNVHKSFGFKDLGGLTRATTGGC